MKKLIAAATFFLGMGAAVNAADLGNGLSAGAELDVNYTTGSEVWVYKITPEVGYSTPWGIDLSAETSLMIDDVEFEFAMRYGNPSIHNGLEKLKKKVFNHTTLLNLI